MGILKIRRAIAFFDLETTGPDPTSDRVVEISVLRREVDGSSETRTRRVNPGRPIPPEATAVHGIRDEDVRDAPSFRQIGRGILEFFGDADLAGFNVLRFDVPLLDRELRECGLDLGLAQRRVIDVMSIFHRKEPRDLAAAVRFYLGREHRSAHSAEADVLATAEVLEAQLERYPDLPRELPDLERVLRPAALRDAADISGKFVWKSGDLVFGFGKHAGRALREVAREHRDYLEWILRNDFPSDARQIVEGALRGTFPEAPVR